MRMCMQVLQHHGALVEVMGYLCGVGSSSQDQTWVVRLGSRLTTWQTTWQTHGKCFDG